MIINHDTLVEKAVELLIKKGFEPNEIFKEFIFKIDDKRHRIIDVVGIKKDKTIAIECGEIHSNMNLIKGAFDEIIILPYVKKQGNRFYCSKCDHEWIAKKEKPKACPNCKKYIFYSKVDDNIKILDGA